MRRRSWVICSLVAAIAYLTIAAWNFRGVLPAPATLLPENPHLEERFLKLGRLDQTMVMWVVTGNAHRLVTRPWALRAEGQCHPLPRAYTLGEHMLGEGLLAALPLALSGDPILSYNAMLLATVWIPALTMFALVLHFTRSPSAAFVAGLLFCLEPARIKDSGHPFIHGDLWAPLGLLFLHRTFARGGLGNALAVALFLGLTVLESLYALLSSMIVVGTYGLYAMITHRRQIRRWLGPLLLSASLVCGVAVVVLRPYLVTRATWDVLVRPGTIFMPPAAYAPGNLGFPGWIVLILVLIALADRLRQRRDEEGEDPRLAYALAALLVMWCSVRTLTIAGVELPSPFLLLKRVLPGLDAVRALAAVGRGAALGAAVVAGYGVLAASEIVGRRRAPLVAALLGVVLLAERYVPAIALANFGTTLDLGAYAARPADDEIALLRAHARGAILDFPARFGAQNLGSGEDLLLASYSPRPTAACYNSYPSPLQDQVAELASTLPGVNAVDALVALGFETLVVHADQVRPRRLETFTGLVQGDPQIAARVTPLGRTEHLLVYRLTSPVAVVDDPAQLVPAAPPGDPVKVAIGRQPIALAIRNAAEQTFALRAPIAPTPVVAEWQRDTGELARVESARMLLPIALAAGATATARVELTTPDAPGTYVLTIRRSDDPNAAPLAATSVVLAAAPGAAPP